jgi:hypothetical protein
MKHFVIPDVQIRPGDDTKFLTNIGKYIVAKKPDKVICIGDFADMPSLSSYDVGKKSHEGKRYTKDVLATHSAMEALLKPLWEFNLNARHGKHKQYIPELHLFLGNHENRINKAVENDAKLEGAISIEDLAYANFGWKVYPFLEVGVLDGVAYSHYFTSGVLGRPCTSAQAQLTKKHQSCVAGHQQGLQIAMGNRADGSSITSIIAGSCYEHDEDYMGPQGNKHFRGCLMLYDVADGAFNPVAIPLSFINNKYAN